MTIRILSCTVMQPWVLRRQEGTTCLLVESDQGWVLVDTGLGLNSYFRPSGKMRFFFHTFGIIPDPDFSAVRQLARLGIRSVDIRHIVLSHAHFDHAGGIPDFPLASVHLHAKEHQAIFHPKKLMEIAYHHPDFAGISDWCLYHDITEKWLGWEAIRLPFNPEMYLVPFFWHSRGHCGIAIRDGREWILYCGDAIPLNADFDITPGWLNRMILGPHGKAIRIWSEQHPEVRLVAGHMWQSLYQTV